MRRNTHRIGILISMVLVGVLVVLALGCGTSSTPSPSPSASKPAQSSAAGSASPSGSPASSAKPAAQKVKLGVVGPQSGGAATLGEQALHGVQDAIEDIGAAGGIKSLGGANFELVVADHQGKPELALSETARLIEQDKVSALLGALLSATCMTATQAAEEGKTPILVPLGVADAITERGFKYTFRETAKTSWSGPERFDSFDYIGKIRGKKLSRFAILYEDTDFGQSTAKAMKPLVDKRGYELVADVAYPNGAPDMTPYITKLKSANPDIVLHVGYTADAINITKTADRLGLKTEFVGTAGMADQQWLQNVGQLAEGQWIDHLWNTDLKLTGAGNGLAALIEKSTKKWNVKPIPEWAIYYQATWVMKTAFENAGSTDREKVRDALAKMQYTGPAFTMPFKGNKIFYGPDGQTPEGVPVANILMQIQDGKYVTVYPEEFAAGKAK